MIFLYMSFRIDSRHSQMIHNDVVRLQNDDLQPTLCEQQVDEKRRKNEIQKWPEMPTRTENQGPKIAKNCTKLTRVCRKFRR